MQTSRMRTLTRRFASEVEKAKNKFTSLSQLIPPDAVLIRQAKSKNETHQEYHAIKSIFFQYKNITDIDQTKIDILNKKSLYDGLQSIGGPKSLLSEREKERINRLADERLKELEESDLSREEIIGSSGKGISLAQDPFFQIIKNDYKARDRLFKDNEEYSVKKIVLYALQQDIGYDTSVAGTGKRVKVEESIFNRDKAGLPKNLYKEHNTTEYFVSETAPSLSDYKIKDPLDDYKPIVKEEYKRPIKEIKLDVNDIHWRNTPLLLQFMTNTGRVKHRLRTGLSKPMQRRVVRVIKHARCMNLIPAGAHVKPYHQIPLRTLHEDLNDEIAYDVDLENGSLIKKSKNSGYDFRRDHFTFTYGFMEPKQIVTSDKTAELIEQAKTYATYLKQQYMSSLLKEGNIKDSGKQMVDGRFIDSKVDIVNESEAQKCRPAYEQLLKELKNIPVTNFMDLLFAESNQNPDVINQLKAVGESIKGSESDLKAKSYDELLSEVETIKGWVKGHDSKTSSEAFTSKFERDLINLLTNKEKEA